MVRVGSAMLLYVGKEEEEEEGGAAAVVVGIVIGSGTAVMLVLV